MGVPAFFRWLSEKYPKIVSSAMEEAPLEVGGMAVPVDASKPNPNNIEFDNLYLDMNGIIHPCCHPEGEEQPETEDEMILNIFKYVERVFNLVRPRQLLYLAIDGTAPRAKMNQQRSRRFRSAKDAAKAKKIEEELRASMEQKCLELPAPKSHWDSNVITPGTAFMAKLANALRYFIYKKMNEDPAWKNVKVILSDASVPGEGEHKIVEFIRLERLQQGYNPNTKHVIHGLDADLIMLALATHEPHFTILRERVFENGRPVNRVLLEAGKSEYEYRQYLLVHVNILREYLQRELVLEKIAFPYDFERVIDDFIFLCFFVGNDFLPHLPSLDIREGALDLLITLYKENLGRIGGYLTKNGDVNLGRVEMLLYELGKVEDELFINRMRHEQYQQSRSKRRRESDEKRPFTKSPVTREQEGDAVLFKLGTHIEHTQKLVENKQAAQELKKQLLLAVTSEEKPQQSIVVAENADQAIVPHLTPAQPTPTIPGKADNASAIENAENVDQVSDSPVTASVPLTPITSSSTENKDEVRSETISTPGSASSEQGIKFDEEEEYKDVAHPAHKRRRTQYDNVSTLKPALEERTTEPETPESKEVNEERFKKLLKEKIIEKSIVDPELHPDVVKFGTEGWKERYYATKFKISRDSPSCKHIFQTYIEGLVWVMRYYYMGCQSWNWYYPYHYAPFASDLTSIRDFNISFDLGTPFHPFDQLMAVFPPGSSHALPEHYQKLMNDKNSPINDFYPDNFEIDLNGKRMEWMGVALLPFIDQERLLAATSQIEKTLTDEEQKRNSFGSNLIYLHAQHSLAELISPVFKQVGEEGKDANMRVEEGSKYGIVCTVRAHQLSLPLSQNIISPIIEDESVLNNQVICAEFDLPEKKIHACHLLEGVKLPEPQLDLDETHQIIIPQSNKRMIERLMGRQIVQQDDSYSYSRHYDQSKDRNIRPRNMYEPQRPGSSRRGISSGGNRQEMQEHRHTPPYSRLPPYPRGGDRNSGGSHLQRDNRVSARSFENMDQEQHQQRNLASYRGSSYGSSSGNEERNRDGSMNRGSDTQSPYGRNYGQIAQASTYYSPSPQYDRGNQSSPVASVPQIVSPYSIYSVPPPQQHIQQPYVQSGSNNNYYGSYYQQQQQQQPFIPQYVSTSPYSQQQMQQQQVQQQPYQHPTPSAAINNPYYYSYNAPQNDYSQNPYGSSNYYQSPSNNPQAYNHTQPSAGQLPPQQKP